MRNKIIIGNWKMNKTVNESNDFIDQFIKIYQTEKNNIHTNLQMGLCVPTTSFACFKKLKSVIPNFIVGSQNMHYEDNGAYTGEISSKMLLNIGIKTVIIGHSERRQYYNETDETVNKKVKKAIAEGMLPIMCVGESLKDYENNNSKVVVEKQLKNGLQGIDPKKVVIAYEPIWAIGTGKTATAEIAQDMCKFIRQNADQDTLIQYGGSVNPTNIVELMSQPDIDGALVGGAALTPESFIKLLTF